MEERITEPPSKAGVRAPDGSALEALGRHEDRLEKIAAAVSGVIFTFRLKPDGSMSFPYTSAGAIEIFGLGPEELMKDGTAAFARVHSDDLGRLHAAIAESARTLHAFRLVWRMLIPQRGEIWTEGHSVPQAEPEGCVLWHGILLDVTERERAKEALQRAKTHEVLGTLAEGIAHDFNNVLLAITGNTSLAIADLPPDHPALESLAEVAKAGARATELVRRIAALGRPQAEKSAEPAPRLVMEDARELARAVPPATPTALEAAQAEAAGAAPARRGRVLYVDDEAALVLMARRSLTRFGWDVTGFTDPAKALEEFQLAPGEFDVVVTDAAMPGMPGIELAAKLRATRPDLPIVLASGNLRPEDQEACERLGVREFLQKPFALAELCGVLDRLRAR